MKNVHAEAFVRYMLIIIVIFGGLAGLGMFLGLGAWLLTGSARMAGEIVGFVLGLGLCFWLGFYVTALGIKVHQAKSELSKLIVWAEKKGYKFVPTDVKALGQVKD